MTHPQLTQLQSSWIGMRVYTTKILLTGAQLCPLFVMTNGGWGVCHNIHRCYHYASGLVQAHLHSSDPLLGSVHILFLFMVVCLGLRWLQWVCTAAGYVHHEF